MNIYSKLLLGAAVLSFAACSNEEPLVGGEDAPQEVIKPSGDVAYLNVCLQSADGNSRAGVSTSGDYYYGDENTVANAYFYFYDKDGKFVLESNTWLGGNNVEGEHIEMQGKTTVVLTGLTDKEYPNWVVTVLNRPAKDAEGNDFTPGATLEEMGKILLSSYKSGDNFIMTTSSFFGGVNAANASDYTYFATKLKATDFKEEGKENADATIVNIYVERLAARVGVSLALDPTVNPKHDKKFTFNGEEYDLYGLNVSVAGNDNPDLGGTGTSTGTAATKVYVAIIGWELNSTANQTNLMKDLTGWNETSVIGGNTTNQSWWNKPDHHRSFWGKSFTYGKALEDLTAALNTNEFAWSDLKKKVSEGRFLGDRAYCNETTNIPTNITKDGLVSPKYTPTVVLSAVVCDKDGNPLQLVKYQGVEYTRDSFVKRILALANSVKYYTRTGNNFNQIAPADVDVVSAGIELGSVKIALKDTNINYYKLKAGATAVDGVYTENDFEDATAADINAHFAGYTDAAHVAIAKTDGSMYYTIPLTHLNKPTGDAIVEGQYGLVRNHIYDLSITKIKTLGEGVFDPTNEKVDPEDPKDPTYYVESAINILSWKIVSQQVEI